MLRKLLDRPIAVTMTAIVLVILGIVSCRLLPISLVPDVDAPYITIQIPAQGISARQLNETVITPLRQQLIQLSRLTDLRSEAREGNGIIRLTFEQGSDIDYLFIEVNEKIDRSVASLPARSGAAQGHQGERHRYSGFLYQSHPARRASLARERPVASCVRGVFGAESFRHPRHHETHRATPRGGDGRSERMRLSRAAGPAR